MTEKGRTTAVTRYDGTDIAPGERELTVVLLAARTVQRRARRLAPTIIEQRAIAPRRRRRGRLWGYAGLAAVLPAGVLAWLVASSLSGTGRTNSVEVTLSSGIEIDLPELPPPAKAKAEPKAAPLPIAEDSEKEKPPAAASALMTVDRLPEVEAAVRIAFANGVAQPWAAKGLDGYVVTGPVQIEATHVCRNIAIWAKAAGASEGRTVSTRKCMAQGGAWVDVGKPEMVVSEPSGPPVPDGTATPG